MSITGIEKDPQRLTMTVTAEYDVSADRAWQLWGDPRQLERWWGPPTYPATVVDHDLATGRPGDLPHDRARVATRTTATGTCSSRRRRATCSSATASPTRTGRRDEELPRTHMTVSIADRAPSGVLVTIDTRFPSLEAMEQLLAMGMEEGMREAMGQIDAVLAAASVG